MRHRIVTFEAICLAGFRGTRIAGQSKSRVEVVAVLEFHFEMSVEESITEAGDIYRLGCHILARERFVSRPLRLIAIGVSSLGEAVSRQLVLSLK